MLANEHEEPGRRDRGGAEKNGAGRHLAEHEPAEQERLDHRRVLEGRDDRGVGEAVGLGQKDLADAARSVAVGAETAKWRVLLPVDATGAKGA